jgi:hypothetical protein
MGIVVHFLYRRIKLRESELENHTMWVNVCSLFKQNTECYGMRSLCSNCERRHTHILRSNGESLIQVMPLACAAGENYHQCQISSHLK